jgi:hypothetical protein
MQFRSILRPNVVKIERIGVAYARDWSGARARLDAGSAGFIGQNHNN